MISKFLTLAVAALAIAAAPATAHMKTRMPVTRFRPNQFTAPNYVASARSSDPSTMDGCGPSPDNNQRGPIQHNFKEGDTFTLQLAIAVNHAGTVHYGRVRYQGASNQVVDVERWDSRNIASNEGVVIAAPWITKQVTIPQGMACQNCAFYAWYETQPGGTPWWHACSDITIAPLNPYCSSHACPTQHIGDPNTRECTEGTCTDQYCCTPQPGTCSQVPQLCASVQNMVMVPNAATQQCQGAVCNTADCCLPAGRCNDIQCSAGLVKNNVVVCANSVCIEQDCCIQDTTTTPTTPQPNGAPTPIQQGGQTPIDNPNDAQQGEDVQVEEATPKKADSVSVLGMSLPLFIGLVVGLLLFIALMVLICVKNSNAKKGMMANAQMHAAYNFRGDMGGGGIFTNLTNPNIPISQTANIHHGGLTAGNSASFDIYQQRGRAMSRMSINESYNFERNPSMGARTDYA